MFARMKEDIRCIMEQDPAARSIFEVIITYATPLGRDIPVSTA